MEDFRVSSFMEMVYEDVVQRAGDPLEEIGNWEAYRRKKKEQIREMLRLPLLEQRYSMPLSWRKLESTSGVEEGQEMEGASGMEECQEAESISGMDRNQEAGGVSAAGIHIEKYRVDAIRNLPLSVHVLWKETADGTFGENRKAVLFLCGHDPRGAKGAYQSLAPDQPALGMVLAQMGYVVLVPELFAFGEAKRREAEEDLGACESCAQTEPWLLNCGLNLVGIRVWEAMKTLDFAQTALGIGAFGVYGISGGGHICNYVGVLDERFSAVMVSGYPNLYKHSTLAMVHCICNYVPGQIEMGESHHITALAAPEKKLLVMNGREDPIFPIEGSRVVFPYLEELYRRLGAEDHFSAVLFDGGHEVAVPEVCQWLEENWPA